MKIEELDLPLQIVNILYAEEIYSVDELLKYNLDKLTKFKGIGFKRALMIEAALNKAGYELSKADGTINIDSSVWELIGANRIAYYLEKSGIMTIRDLTNTTANQLLSIKGIRDCSLSKIQKLLFYNGFKLSA